MDVNPDIAALLTTIKLAVFDFDGVFTDNRVIVSEAGKESVACCRSDGIGLRRLREAGVETLIISTEPNPVVAVRAAKLGITCIHGSPDKLAQLRDEATRRKLSLDEVAFVGNDVNDAGCLQGVGLPVVVADAWPEVKTMARVVLSRKGGEGAVREFCDMVVENR